MSDEDDRLKSIFRGKGAGDSYILRPTFYTRNRTVLILAETGAEYTWGLEAYEFTDGTLAYLGSLDVAFYSGENYENPLERSKVSTGEDGYRVEFSSDLVLDPGGIHEWTLTRVKETITFVQDSGRFVLTDDSVGSQACFFFLGEAEDGTEARSDLLYYYGQVVPWLESNRLSHSFQSEAPLEMIAARDNEIVIRTDELNEDLGVVLMTEDGRKKILYGVYTDLDLISEMGAFFAIGRD